LAHRKALRRCELRHHQAGPQQIVSSLCANGRDDLNGEPVRVALALR
jgi:hypothetical protein